MVVVGGIYSPNHQFNCWGGCLSMGASDSLVRHRTLSGAQRRHPTVRVLMVLTVGALTSWGTGQSGATPDSYCSVSGAL
jgi:agmatine/peptidylarginine deiminase